LRLRLESAALKSGDAAVRGDIEAAEAETERLTRLLNGLLALAREGAPAPAVAPLALSEHVAAAVERWRARAHSNGGRLRIEHGADTAARISQDDLAVILDNLIENAIEYGGRRSTVIVEWAEVDGSALLVVTDDGPGVPAGEEERVFERFHRARGDVPGTGLGLPIVRALAERWGGTARIRNAPTGGARAEVRLPAAPRLPDLDPQLDDALPTRG
jgi:signal transduction histidine kinase